MDTWDVSSVTNMTWMFAGAYSFNQPIGGWDVSNVIDMEGMFRGADSFNQPIGNWDVSRVTNMHTMFYSTDSFNQPIGGWNVSSVTDMQSMFTFSSSFNQDISIWDVSSVTYMEGMFSFANLSIQNYDNLLIGWAELPLQNGVNFDAGYSLYSDNSVANRQKIIDTFAWTIVDGGHTESSSTEILITSNTDSDAIPSSETTEDAFLSIMQLISLWPLLVIVVIRKRIKNLNN
jgi:surface protein